MTAPVRVAAIGLGWVCQNRHLPVMDRSPRFDVVGVIDRAPGRAGAIAKQRGYRHFSEAATLADIDWLDQVDAITVATAPMTHFALVEEAIARGKHVLTEKPFTMTVAEGTELVAAANSADRRLAIVHNFQFARSTRRLFDDLASGALGTIRGVDAVQFGNPGRRLPTWCEELPMGLFYDESPHLLYLLRAVAGQLSLARSLVVPSQTGLATPARIEAYFRGDKAACPIRLSCNFESPVSEWYLMVSGDQGLGIVDIFRDIYIRLPNDGRHDTLKVLRTSRVATFQHWLQHLTSGIPHLTGRLSYGNDELFDRFGRAIGGETAALAPIDGASALAVLTLQHAIIDSAEAIYA
ncbi:MAG: Gfo/Idh/MocA family oxidoreductase [Sphingomonas sp.]|jgi:predicted dehydrogenase|uniref:Gfo/Idh/MocA family protein n=1 Tax=Sphingomonas sp. TaxID=28214 RepID=UPI003567E515